MRWQEHEWRACRACGGSLHRRCGDETSAHGRGMGHCWKGGLSTLISNIVNSPNSLRPQELVQAGVNTNVFGSHLLLGKLTDFINGSGSTLLGTTETRIFVNPMLIVGNLHSVKSLVDVDCVLASNHLVEGTLGFALSLVCRSHCYLPKSTNLYICAGYYW